jgi:hypothetical protein
MMRRLLLVVLLGLLLASCSASTVQQGTMLPSAPEKLIESRTPTTGVTQLPTATATSLPTEIPATQTAVPAPFFNLFIDNLAISPQGKLFASGFNQGDDTRHYAEWDGTQWAELGAGFSTAGNSLAVDGAGNLYTETITDTANCMAIMKWGGTTWEDITSNFTTVVDALKPGRVSCNVPVVALAVDGEDHLYAAGAFYYLSADNTQELPMGYVAMWNNGSWSVLGEGFDGVNIHALVAGLAGNIYVAGEQPSLYMGKLPVSGFVAQWDGKKWLQMETDQPEACTSVVQLASDTAGGVYAGCTPTGPGEIISHWDGTTWTTISDQLEGEAPTIFDMAVNQNGLLYIGGDFEAVSGVPASKIAYWDGSTWHALGDGVNERVQALALDPNGELYVAGWFTEAGGEQVDHIAGWDGKDWHALVP